MEPHHSRANLNKCDPLVSVIIPAYNAERFIGETIESVRNQTYCNLEIIVVDDGSQDMTAAIVRHCMQDDARIKLVHQANAGVAAARNHGIKESKGEFVAPVDADDTWEPCHVARQVECFLNSPAIVGLVYSWSFDINEDSRPTGSIRAAQIQGHVYTTLICHNFIGNASATMMRRRILDEIGGYDSSLRERMAQGCEDWDLYLRIAERYMFNVVPECSVGYRKPVSSMSGDCDQMARSHAFVMEAVRQRNQKLPRFLFRLSASNLYLYFAHQCQARNQRQETLRWMRRTLLADPLTCWIRPGYYILLVLVNCLPILHKSKESKLDHFQPRSDNNAPFRRARIKSMVVVGSVFHVIITLLTSKPTSLLQNLKVTSGAKAC